MWLRYLLIFVLTDIQTFDVAKRVRYLVLPHNSVTYSNFLRIFKTCVDLKTVTVLVDHESTLDVSRPNGYWQRQFKKLREHDSAVGLDTTLGGVELQSWTQYHSQVLRRVILGGHIDENLGKVDFTPRHMPQLKYVEVD